MVMGNRKTTLWDSAAIVSLLVIVICASITKELFQASGTATITIGFATIVTLFTIIGESVTT